MKEKKHTKWKNAIPLYIQCKRLDKIYQQFHTQIRIADSFNTNSSLSSFKWNILKQYKSIKSRHMKPEKDKIVRIVNYFTKCEKLNQNLGQQILSLISNLKRIHFY